METQRNYVAAALAEVAAAAVPPATEAGDTFTIQTSIDLEVDTDDEDDNDNDIPPPLLTAVNKTQNIAL